MVCHKRNTWLVLNINFMDECGGVRMCAGVMGSFDFPLTLVLFKVHIVTCHVRLLKSTTVCVGVVRVYSSL